MPELTEMKCVACRGDEPLATDDEIKQWKPQVPDWELVEGEAEKKLRRTFKLKNFAQALELVNRIGVLAEEEDHHPLIEFTWGKVTVTWWTHKIKGLHRNDFIMAAKTDEAYTAQTSAA